MTEDKHVPCWRYNATQGAKLITTEDELAEAEAQGWRDSPGAAAAVSAEAFPEIEAAMPDDDKARFEMAQAIIPKKRKR